MDAQRCCAAMANGAIGRCDVERRGRASRKICNRGGMAAMGLSALRMVLRRDVAAMKKLCD